MGRPEEPEVQQQTYELEGALHKWVSEHKDCQLLMAIHRSVIQNFCIPPYTSATDSLPKPGRPQGLQSGWEDF